MICALVWILPPPSSSWKVTSALACPWPPDSRAFTRSTARCAASSFSTTSTVPTIFIDMAPILSRISALAESGPVRSVTLPPSTAGTTRSRSRIEA